MPLPKIERRGDAISHPAKMVDLAMAIRARCWALVFVGDYSGLRMGELAGIRQSRVDR